MSDSFVDTDVLVRFITGDDPTKHAAADALCLRVATDEIAIAAPESVIADTVYVLSSPRLYAMSRDRVRQALVPLLGLPSFRVRNRREVLRALDLYATTRLDFSDALLVAAMEQEGVGDLYAYDTHCDRIAGITRPEP